MKYLDTGDQSRDFQNITRAKVYLDLDKISIEIFNRNDISISEEIIFAFIGNSWTYTYFVLEIKSDAFQNLN